MNRMSDAFVPRHGRPGSERVSVAHLFPARDVERCVGDDTMQPGAERLIRQEPIERTVCMEKSFLHGVLRVLVREHDGASDRIGSSLVKPDEVRKRLRLPTLSGDDQRVLTLARRVTSHGARASRRLEGVRGDGECESGHEWVA